MENLELCSYAKKSIPPCKKCEYRTAECHGECIRYIKWAKAEKAKKDKGYKKYISEREKDDFCIESHNRKNRRRHLW